MSTETKRVEGKTKARRFKIQYPISDYTFPQEARIHAISFSDEYMHVDLTDGRKLSVPLWCILTLHHALPEEREKFEINQSQTMVIWDPE